MKIEFELANERDRTIAVNELIDDFIKRLKLLGVKVITHTKLPKEVKG